MTLQLVVFDGEEVLINWTNANSIYGPRLHDESASNTSSPSPPSSISMAEATFYYSGLYSSPRLVYRTGTTPWTKPTGPEAQRQLKQLRPVFGHKLNTLLDSQGVVWTSIDVVRFIKVGEGEAVGPVVLWIGVAPDTLFHGDARTSASSCLDLLKKFDIIDVEVEYRAVDVRSPLTPAPGLSIAALATPHAEGTGGLYLTADGDSEKVLLVTARHVLFPPNEQPNIDYARTNTGMRRRNVLLLGTKAFDNLVRSIKIRIGGHGIMVEWYERQIEKLRAREAGEDEDDIQSSLTETNDAIKALEKFHDQVKKEWSQPSQRILGHIAHSPPITLGAGKEGFTEDYAIVELDSSKFKKPFKGNVIDLVHVEMYPRIDAPSSFKYPDDRLLQLRDPIPEDLMRNPDMLDQDGESCLLVIKNGNTTGVTIGRATGVFSFVREYFNNNTQQTSMEWAILPYDNKSGVFSAPGDSGSIIADGRGRVGGLLTGGAGKTESSDITYATPFFGSSRALRKTAFLMPTSTGISTKIPSRLADVPH
ncbi:hypothetical protein BC834DRAFT_921886 [Gloeopeniophorella convolvens]|nr:hypothetical protein BC834DRAFT_921886 [Gloeopeniophorella convolvens]